MAKTRLVVLAGLMALAGCGRAAVTASPTRTQHDDPLRPPAIQTQNVPVVPAELAARWKQYNQVRYTAFRGWSPDGRGVLVRTRFGDTYQLHRVYEPGGRRQQVTFFDEPADGRFIPKANDGAMLVTMSSGGDENYQVFFFDPAAGGAIHLTDGRSRNTMGPVRRDGRLMVIANNSRNGRDTDLYLGDPRNAFAPGSLKPLLLTDGEYWSAADFSHDGKKLLINRYVSRNESYPALLDVASGAKAAIARPPGTPADQKVSFGSLAFAPDGEQAYVTCDARGEFRQLARIDLASGDYAWLTEDIPWDVESVEVEPSSGLVAFTVNEDGASALYLLDGDRRTRVELPLGIIGSLDFSPDGKQLGFSLARPDAPTDAYSIRLADHALTRWTYSEVGGLNADAFVTPKRITFKSFDGRDIPAYVFLPRGASKDKPVPVILDIHGGPESQYRPYFSARAQFYVNELGAAVIAPNVRGSAGYGKTYLKLDNAQKREDSVRDIGGLLDWIAQQPDLDASRVAVTGGSYGGYMVLATLEHFGPRIRCGVDVVGIASFTTFLKNTSAYRRDLRRAEYGDERDPAMARVFARINPTANADKIVSPLLVAHGRNDPRVPFTEAKQIADAVRANGREVWTLYADNEGHGFGKQANRDYLGAVEAMFLRKQLK